MKKLFTIFGVFLLVGGGCLGMGEQVDQPDENDGQAADGWWLAFDLPEGWVTYADYQGQDDSPQDIAITRELNDIIVQSTELPIVLEGDDLPEEEGAQYADDDYTYIRVFRFDPRTSVPDDSEDIGDGFFKRTVGDEVIYYYAGEQGKYKFTIEQESQDISAAEEVILTAQEAN